MIVRNILYTYRRKGRELDKAVNITQISDINYPWDTMKQSKLFTTQSRIFTILKKKKAFWKQCRKRRKCCQPAFSSFPTMFSILSRTDFTIWITFNLSSANAFNLDWSEILSFGKELKKVPSNTVENTSLSTLSSTTSIQVLSCSSSFFFLKFVLLSFFHNV